MRKTAGMRGACVVLMVSMLAASGAENKVTIKEIGYEITFPETWKVIKDPKFPTSFEAKSPDATVDASVDNQQSKNFKTLKGLRRHEVR